MLNEARLRAPVDTGLLRASLSRKSSGNIWEMDRDKPPMRLAVGTKVHYAPAMEFGTGDFAEAPQLTRGWQFPTGRDLNVWARRHGFSSGKHVSNIIKARGGLTPRRFMRDGLKNARSQIASHVDTLAKEIVEELVD